MPAGGPTAARFRLASVAGGLHFTWVARSKISSDFTPPSSSRWPGEGSRACRPPLAQPSRHEQGGQDVGEHVAERGGRAVDRRGRRGRAAAQDGRLPAQHRARVVGGDQQVQETNSRDPCASLPELPRAAIRTDVDGLRESDMPKLPRGGSSRPWPGTAPLAVGGLASGGGGLRGPGEVKRLILV